MYLIQMPLLDTQSQNGASRHDHTAIVVGGYSPQCRWYSEDAATLAENMRVSEWMMESNKNIDKVTSVWWITFIPNSWLCLQREQVSR